MGATMSAPAGAWGPRRIVAEYDYCDEFGALLFQVLRYTPKGFSQRRPDGRGGWIPSVKGVRHVLYRLPAVINAAIVLVVEGEKDADTATDLGFVATCNAGGAGKWRAEYAEHLRNRLLAGSTRLPPRQTVVRMAERTMRPKAPSAADPLGGRAG